MVLKPASFPDGRRALVAALALIGLDLVLIALMVARPVGGATFLLLLLALALWLPILYLLWRAWVCFSLAYWIDRNALTLAWGPIRQVIPLGDIEAVRRGEAVAAALEGVRLAQGPNGQIDQPARTLAARWPALGRYLIYGADLGTRRLLPFGKVYSIASRPLSEQVLLHTPQSIFGISPADADAFLTSLQDHHQLGPTRRLQLQRRWPRVMRWPLWQDRFLLILLAAGFLGTLALLGLAISRFSALPFALPQWDNLDRRLIFAFPIFGLAVWLVNGIWGLLVYPRQRVAAGLLWGGALVAQAAAFIALFKIVQG